MRFRSEVVACGVVYAAARKFKVPLPDRWWEVFDARWSEVEVVCKVLAELYKQPKGHYVEVGRDSKSFVLTSKAWDAPIEGQVRSFTSSSGVLSCSKSQSWLDCTYCPRDVQGRFVR